MRSLPVVLLLVALAGCASPPPPLTSTPAASPTASSPSTTSPSPSPTPLPSTSITCLRETAPLPSALAGDPCPAALAAVRALVAPLGLPIARIYLAPDPFFCGDLWPEVGSSTVCAGPIILPGRTMHGWVAFTGTAKIAAVALDRPYPPAGSPTASAPQWQATLAAFVVPPAGWVMP